MAYSKTEIGQRTFKDRSVPLTPRQRSAFIMFDGRRSLAEVLAATAGLGVTAEDVDYMLQMGLLDGTPGAPPANSRPAPLDSRPMSLSGFGPSIPGQMPPSRPVPLDNPSRPMPLGGASRPAPLGAGPVSTEDAQSRYKKAYPIATQLTAGMGLRGFRLNLAVEGSTSYEQLLEVAPKIKDAVGPEKFKPLDAALKGL